jgi:long-chain-fatty-acyl-CoA reductase
VNIDLPFIIGGERLDADPDSAHEIQFGGGNSIRVPHMTLEIAEAICRQPRHLLADVPLDEIVAFLVNVGHNWKSKEYSRRRVYIRHLCRFLGYSEKMADTEANWIALLLSSHYRLYDMLETELGSRHMVDEWVPREEAYIRAVPRGRALHILPGNVPISTVASFARGLITKNTTVAKAASEDPITPIALALSCMDVDPTHPVTRSLSVVHWPGGTTGPAQDALLADADAICVWGGSDAVTWAMRNAAADTEVIKFGPRRSVAIVAPGADPTKVARALAHDVSMYDQRACFSVRQVFVLDPRPELAKEIAAALETYRTLVPRGRHDIDELACGSLARLEASFLGDDVQVSEDGGWSIITSAPSKVEAHPLGRTLYVHPVTSFAEILPHLDATVQTLAISPWSLGAQIRDACALRGVARIVELGMNNVFRVGGSHDAMYPLQRLVRYVSHEMPSRVLVKGITTPLDQTTFLEEDRFVEFIP